MTKKFTILDSDGQSKVYTAAEHSVKSIGTGEVIVNTKISRSKKNSVKLKDTLCVPDLRNNLLSVSKVTDNGYTVTFNKHRTTIKRRDGSIALTTIKHNDLYVVNEKQEQANFANEKCDRDLVKWHQRYGHLNINDLKDMKNKDIVVGMRFASKTSEINCEVCARCKIHVQQFKSSTT